MWGRFGQKKAICSHSLALKQRWELTSLQNRLGFLEAINLNLPVLEAHRVIDGRVDTAGSGIVDLCNHCVELVMICSTLLLGSGDIRFLLPLGVSEIRIGLLSPILISFGIGFERLESLLSLILISFGLGFVLDDVLVDHLKDGNNALTLAGLTTIRGLPGGRRRRWGLTCNNWFHLVLLQEIEVVFLIKSSKDIFSTSDQFSCGTIIAVSCLPFRVFIPPHCGGLFELFLDGRNLFLIFLNSLHNLSNVHSERVNGVRSLIHGACRLDGRAGVIGTIFLALFLVLEVSFLLPLQSGNHVINGSNNLIKVATCGHGFIGRLQGLGHGCHTLVSRSLGCTCQNISSTKALAAAG